MNNKIEHQEGGNRKQNFINVTEKYQNLSMIAANSKSKSSSEKTMLETYSSDTSQSSLIVLYTFRYSFKPKNTRASTNKVPGIIICMKTT